MWTILLEVYTPLTTEKIKLLELLVPFMEYVEEKEKYHAAKAQHQIFHDKVSRIREKQAPMTARKK